ncbi:MAG: hypothetical protein J6B68_00250 [Lachnospiraceae bacterium]|nr:hypothetical protein [Lachnospiraceae bacterium]
MRIGGIGSFYSTYVYNANVLSADSMDKLSRISDDVLDQKVDYSGLVQEDNQNPLDVGETLDFDSVLEQQMSEGYKRAAKIFPDGVEPIDGNVTISADGEEFMQDSSYQMQNSTYQMQRAIQAYEMSMIA